MDANKTVISGIISVFNPTASEDKQDRRDVRVGRTAVHEAAAPCALPGAAGPPPHAAGQRVPLPESGGRNQRVRDRERR